MPGLFALLTIKIDMYALFDTIEFMEHLTQTGKTHFMKFALLSMFLSYFFVCCIYAADTPNSDGDGLPDFQEIHKYLTDPTKKDTDGDGIPDGDWNERREYTYSIRSILQFMPPFDSAALNDDFQDARRT